eukprot:230097_1
MELSTHSENPFIYQQKSCVYGYCRQLEIQWQKYSIIIPNGIQYVIFKYLTILDKWNEKTMSKEYKLVNHTYKSIVKHTCCDTWCTAFGTVSVKEPFEWRIKIKHMTNSTYAIFIGIINVENEQILNNGYIGGYEIGYSYNSYGYKYYRNNPVQYGTRFHTNDVIGVYLDTEKWSLSFSKNDYNFGIAFVVPKSKEYKLGITTYYENDEIQLL